MYGNIKDTDLDTPCLRNTEDETLLTIRENIDMLCLDEDIIYADYKLTSTNWGFRVDKFVAWTDSYMVVYFCSIFGDEFFVKYDRNPPPSDMRDEVPDED